MANTCLFIGRFQPFHNGHLMVVQGMRKVCERIIIGVGSPEVPQTPEQPFSVHERHEMISAALLDADIPDADIYDIPDTADDADWVDAVIKATGPIDKVWTGNDLVEKLFVEKGIAVQKIKEVPGISATEVRARLLSGGEWDALVPNGVASVIRRIGGTARMKELSK
ncbi:MAG: nicotinamide-nucleotide adenylyltransferase [Patescibacteria group bacterium]